MNELHSYTTLLEDEFEHVTVTERVHSVPFSESEIRVLEQMSAAFSVIGCASLVLLLDSKIRLWREAE